MNIKDATPMRKQFENDKLIPNFIALMNEGHSVTFRLRGFSMRPFLEDGRDSVLLRKPTDETRKGDVVLAEVAPGRYVLHRVVAVNGDNITLRGDGNFGTEHCKTSDIHGFAVGFYRNGSKRLDSTNGIKWRVYSALWTRLLPIRRYLLFAYRAVRKLRRL